MKAPCTQNVFGEGGNPLQAVFTLQLFRYEVADIKFFVLQLSQERLAGLKEVKNSKQTEAHNFKQAR